MYYGADYYPEHWPRERWATDARLMREAGLNVVRLAEFAWALLEPQEGVFDFAWLDEALEVLGEQGIRAVLGTPTAAPPTWVCQNYPEILAVGRDGHRVTFGMRRQYCPTSATYRLLSERIVAAMAEHYAHHAQVIGWQLDNEFSGHCYCPACQRAFQEWVAGRYGSLQTLNSAWGTAFWSHIYRSWSEIPLPWSTTPVSNPCLELDYWRFMSDQMVAYQQVQLDVVRQRCPGQFITTNLMGFAYQDLDYFDLARPLDLVAWDNYPIGTADDPSSAALGHDAMRGLKSQPFWVMEEQAGPSGWQTMSRAPKPGQLRLWAYQAVAHGADAIVYFRWRTCQFNTEEYWHGILDHDGHPRRRYREVQQMGQELARIGDRLIGARSPKVVAMVLSYDDSWALRLQPSAEGLRYSDVFQGYYRALHHLNVPVDIVSPDADLSGYKVVIVPTLYVLPEAWAENLKRYVAGGGYLVIGARSGVKDVSNRVVDRPLPGLLAELCGLNVEEYDALGRHISTSIRFEPGIPELGRVLCATHTWADILQPHGATVVARYAEDFYSGKPAIARHSYGRGWAVYVGTMGDADFHDLFARWLIRDAKVQPLLATPRGVEVTVRQQGEQKILFLLNHTGDEQVVELPYPCISMLSGASHENGVTLPPREVLILCPA
jgi:beta-galactosidase